MAKSKECYYIAGGRTLAAIAAYKKAYQAHLDYMKALADELGGVTMFGRVEVLAFGIPAAGMPKGWKAGMNPGTMIPRRDASGKVWRERMDAAPRLPDIERAAGLKELDFDNEHAFGPNLGFETYGDIVVVKTHRKADGSSLSGDPLDSERIPDSRYWQIREAAEKVS